MLEPNYRYPNIPLVIGGQVLMGGVRQSRKAAGSAGDICRVAQQEWIAHCHIAVIWSTATTRLVQALFSGPKFCDKVVAEKNAT
jgi:type IV secretory pathway TrbD component